ncbi:DEAD/DEAH box helicase [Gordonia hydrophobica]|uniref:DEAD/DEAH box helicase n=1 Tax=Gordonia hydrophobica TaxID=40516 RepID=A0ABZ2TZ34_9ACTN|nr:DEAD/DEAH box helicase [Gordonia hydrophobica]MBM7367222.1 SNF2 family DNA or RNA helicase [Gordonia hydrophobica]
MIGRTLTPRSRSASSVACQATYLTDRHAFALWSDTGTSPENAGPTVRLPLPEGFGPAKTLRPDDIACRIVDVADLPSDGAPSLAAWRALVDDPEADVHLPGAAHAVLNAAGDAVVSAEYARRVFAATQVAAVTLRDVVDADLRAYQLRGVTWLDEVCADGGGILADEMGLGKTLQTIAHLAHSTTGPVLVVCPTGLVTNWLREIRRWAPTLPAVDYRGGTVPDSEHAPGIIVTGYPTLRRHAAALSERPWATVVFDEAQALKNNRTQVSRAARALTADVRIALTGTPVENDLDELWALLNLVAPTAFGNRALFRRRYSRPIRDGSADAKRRMHDAISGHVLRRTKADVAASLGPKLHTDVECDLTAEQARLYDAILADVEAEGFGVGMARRGAILTALTRLKQLCNHPALVGDGPVRGEIGGRSGKLDVATDIVVTNQENSAPTVVFTQYRQTGDLLAAHLGAATGRPVPFLHGGLSRAERDRIVDDYQSGIGSGVLVASLKAAGTGLTLTRAADVLHFDRWWNPAVEAQATDRVHRIGQDRVVTVTTLTTAGTLEEHIARMHDRKAALDLDSDTSALAALTELSDERLIEVLRRRREEVG